MSLREQLFEAAKPFMEGLESSKEIIATNSASFDEMGMANNNPGEFSDNEITDKDNLVNVGKLSNDTDFEGKVDCDCEEGNDVLSELIKLGDDDDDEEVANIEITKIIGESKLAQELLKALKESDYAGPLDFVPDTRVNASDVLNAVKAEVGQAAAGAHVEKEVDANQNPHYVISQIDEKELPDTIQINTTVLKREGNVYTPSEIAKEYPLGK
jgi:hypothetical protein